MIKRVVLFEDEIVDQRRFQEMAKASGCEILVFNHGIVDEFAEAVLAFNPDLAIVDIGLSGSGVAGFHILRFLRTRTTVPIVVCSVQMDSPDSSRRLYDKCEAIGGVQGLFGKREFPSWQAILNAVNVQS